MLKMSYFGLEMTYDYDKPHQIGFFLVKKTKSNGFEL